MIDDRLEYLMKHPLRKMNKAEISIMKEILCGLSPSYYLESIGYRLFDWQKAVLEDPSTRICINGARQSGKSTIMSGTCCHYAKYHPKSLSVIIAPTKQQSQEDIFKIREFMQHDPEYPNLTKAGGDGEIIIANGSRILVLTASDKAARGFSAPGIVLFDEASRIDDSVLKAVIPMLTGCKRSKIYEISTPFGKKGFFYHHFMGPSRRWSRYLVRGGFEATVGADGTPCVVPSAFQPDLDRYRYFISPRHLDQEEQNGVLETIHYDVRNYNQEYGCEFVSAEDQAFSQDLIDSLFGSEVPEEEIEEHMGIRDIFGEGEPDPAFIDDYRREFVKEINYENKGDKAIRLEKGAVLWQ